jgi:hypothetical protein
MTHAPAAPRSNFVTVVAWVFICLGAGLTLLLALETLVMSVIPAKQIEEMMSGGHGAPAVPLPEYTQLLLKHFGLYMTVYITGTVALFVAAIALLKRKRWARPTMAFLLTLGIIKNLAGAGLSAAFFASTPAHALMPPNAPQGADAMFNNMMAASAIFGIGFSVVIAAVLAWVVVRLLSAQVRAEFEPLEPPQPNDAPAPDARAPDSGGMLHNESSLTDTKTG